VLVSPRQGHKRATRCPLRKAMAQLGTGVLPPGPILARPQRLGAELQHQVAKQQAAAPGAAAPRLAQQGVEAETWVVAPMAAGAGPPAAGVTKTMPAYGDGWPSP